MELDIFNMLFGMLLGALGVFVSFGGKWAAMGTRVSIVEQVVGDHDAQISRIAQTLERVNTVLCHLEERCSVKSDP